MSTGGAGAVAPRTNDEQQVLAAELRRRAAMIALDAATLEALLSDRLLHIHTHGQIETKAEVIASLGRTMRFMAFEPLKPETVVVEGDVAAVTTELAVAIARAGESQAAINLRTCISAVWTRTPAGWRQLVYHAARLTD
ncbi:nuclear transport factor 2 family protein [Phenylobacterium sp.]|uniref:nuclear transport factor 2 family protein n=1 Tax=Phenylobacterium sp. TaxID=1871053 RepID=UPI0027334D98|nr:nuclear transport factor 2 family protein [Phenylobacterium sp.]MDP3658648.1 nuclear transport factor 2 family protein [Phenylobacterium sp.]